MKSKKHSARSAAVEILPTHIRLAVLEPQGEEGDIKVITATVTWRHKAASLTHDDGRIELATALRQLASQYRLANVPVSVALSGDFCVTRVVTGLNEEVRRELAEVEQRSNLYLSLGHGAKATANFIAPIDARHQRAMLSVANNRVLTAITDALSRAGIAATAVEPALVSLCRLVGQLGADSEHPTLVVRGDEHGVEVGITYGGNLLLDYRPAARHAKEQAGEIIGSHLHRLSRYCDRYVRVGGKLTAVFVSGDPGFVTMVDRGLTERGMNVRPLAPQAIDARWNILDATSSPEYAAALGAALVGIRAGQPLSVNLIDPRKSQGGIALVPAAARTLWPVAAMLMVSMTGVGVLQWESRRFHRLEAELTQLEPQQSEARMLRVRAMNDKQEIAHMQRIALAVRTHNWHELSTAISQCMPEDVWLDDLRVDAQGRLQLVGASFTEDGVFEFVRWLEKLPGLQHVALSGTRPTRLDIGPATQFDVRCDFNGASEPKERNDGNG